MVEFNNPKVQKRLARECLILCAAISVGSLLYIILGESGFDIIFVVYILYIASNITIWALIVLGKGDLISDAKLWIHDQLNNTHELWHERLVRDLNKRIDKINNEITAYPDDPELFYDRAGLYIFSYYEGTREDNLLELAKKDLLYCLELDPNYSKAYNRSRNRYYYQ